MMTAWTKGLFLACVVGLPIACTVSVNDDPIDNDGGNGGDAGSASAQGGGGNGGSGNGGSAQGGSTSGSGGDGGTGGSAVFPTPVCTAETNDDECITCLKQQCCDAWRACDDFGCDDEWNAITLCVSEIYTEEQLATEDDLGMCTSENSVDMSGLAQANTNDLIACINEVPEADAGGATRCGVECFGTDIFLE
jgi:hypothetical protein